MKRCLITGATGYIGSHVAAHMAASGWQVGAIVRPTSNVDELEIISKGNIHPYDGNIRHLTGFMQRFRPDAVVHLAAAVNTRPEPEDVSQIVRANIEFGTVLLAAMEVAGVRHMVNTGTYWQNYHSAGYSPVDLYAASKEAFEKIIEYYTSACGFRVTTLRLFDVYGEDDVRPKLWSRLIESARADEPLALTGGEQLINLVHISDVCRAYEMATEMTLDGGSRADAGVGAHIIYDVRSSETRTLRQTIELFQKATSTHLQAEWGKRPYRQREIMTPSFLHPVLPGWCERMTPSEGFTKFNKRGGGVKRPGPDVCGLSSVAA